MQSGKDLLKKLPCAARKKFKRNYILFSGRDWFNEIIHEQHKDLEDFICKSFVFSSTKQGHEYWKRIISKYN